MCRDGHLYKISRHRHQRIGDGSHRSWHGRMRYCDRVAHNTLDAASCIKSQRDQHLFHCRHGVAAPCLMGDSLLHQPHDQSNRLRIESIPLDHLQVRNNKLFARYGQVGCTRTNLRTYNMIPIEFINGPRCVSYDLRSIYKSNTWATK